METITIVVYQDDVYDEVSKATDYTGSKLIDGDALARDRILAGDYDLSELGRFWEESVSAANENLKEMLVSGSSSKVYSSESNNYSPESGMIAGSDAVRIGKTAYKAVIEVSKSFDKGLKDSVESTLRSFFIASIIAQWFKFANKGEAQDYFVQASDMMETAERLLYSRKKPTRPTD